MSVYKAYYDAMRMHAATPYFVIPTIKDKRLVFADLGKNSFATELCYHRAVEKPFVTYSLSFQEVFRLMDSK